MGEWIWGFPKIRVTILGAPILYSILGSILGYPNFRETTICCRRKCGAEKKIGSKRVFRVYGAKGGSRVNVGTILGVSYLP